MNQDQASPPMSSTGQLAMVAAIQHSPLVFDHGIDAIGNLNAARSNRIAQLTFGRHSPQPCLTIQDGHLLIRIESKGSDQVTSKG
jgi:hypothetical protein